MSDLDDAMAERVRLSTAALKKDADERERVARVLCASFEKPGPCTGCDPDHGCEGWDQFLLQADAVIDAAPRSVQAQLLTDEERGAIEWSAGWLEAELEVREAPRDLPDGGRFRVTVNDGLRAGVTALRALLARAARGQDGEQQP